MELQDGLDLHAGNATYTPGGSAETARNNIIATDGWTISDGGASTTSAIWNAGSSGNLSSPSNWSGNPTLDNTFTLSLESGSDTISWDVGLTNISNLTLGSGYSGTLSVQSNTNVSALGTLFVKNGTLSTDAIVNTTSYSQKNAGSLTIELNTTNPSEYGQINATSSVYLSGTLLITESIAEAAGQSFTIINSPLIIGQFDDVQLPILSAGLAWDLANLYENGTLSIVSTTTNVAPSIGINSGLTLNQGDVNIISSLELQESDPDDSGVGITFMLGNVPNFGALWLDTDASNTLNGEEVALTVGSTFTQADIDNNFLKYQHISLDQLSDSFQFEMRDGGEDGALPVTSQVFNFTINIVNNPPVGLPIITGTALENEILSVNTSGITDADGLGSLNIQWLSNGVVIANATSTTYSLEDADVGQLISVSVSYTDGSGYPESVTSDASTQVLNVNDPPLLLTQPNAEYQVFADESFNFLASATDPDSTLIYSTNNLPYWLSIDESGMVTGRPNAIDAGIYENIQIQVSDGITSVSFNAFSIEVVLSEEDASEVDAAETALVEAIDNTPEQGPTIPDLVMYATGYFTPLPEQNILAILGPNFTDAKLWREKADFQAGRHTLYWIVTDTQGTSFAKRQSLMIFPFIAFAGDPLTLAEGSQGFIRIRLSGDSPVYPLNIDVSVQGSSTPGVDHSLMDRRFEMNEPIFDIPVETYQDSLSESDEIISINLRITTPEGVRVGSISDTRVVISDSTAPPRLNLSVTQASQPGFMMLNNSEPLQVTAALEGSNLNNTMTLTWSLPITFNQISETDLAVSIDVEGVAPGVYPITATLVDGSGLDQTETIWIRLMTQKADLSDQADTDGDEKSDLLEGFLDLDRDYIPDYLDPYHHPHALPMAWHWQNSHHLETSLSLQISLGIEVLSLGQVGVIFNQENMDYLTSALQNGDLGTHAQLSTDNLFSPLGYNADQSYYSFQVRDLNQAGDSVYVSLPLTSALNGDQQLVFFQNGDWRDFISDTDNTIYSTQGQPGICPEPVLYRYQPGLTSGSQCLLLRIEDGGLNDRDGESNGVVAALLTRLGETSNSTQGGDQTSDTNNTNDNEASENTDTNDEAQILTTGNTPTTNSTGNDEDEAPNTATTLPNQSSGGPFSFLMLSLAGLLLGLRRKFSL